MIIRYPNDILTKRAERIQKFDTELNLIVQSMLDEMYKEGGIGLAAPQIGKNLSIIVVDISKESSNPFIMINPKLTLSGPKLISKEGCLSIPGRIFEISRFSRVDITYQDVLGEEKKEYYEGQMAIVLQHECDHLAGITLFERAKLNRNLSAKKRPKRG